MSRQKKSDTNQQSRSRKKYIPVDSESSDEDSVDFFQFVLGDKLDAHTIFVTGSTPKAVADRIAGTAESFSRDKNLAVDFLAILSLSAISHRRALIGYLKDDAGNSIKEYLDANFTIGDHYNYSALNIAGHCLLAAGGKTDNAFIHEAREKIGGRHIWSADFDKGHCSDEQIAIFEQRRQMFKYEDAKLAGITIRDVIMLAFRKDTGKKAASGDGPARKPDGALRINTGSAFSSSSAGSMTSGSAASTGMGHRMDTSQGLSSSSMQSSASSASSIPLSTIIAGMSTSAVGTTAAGMAPLSASSLAAAISKSTAAALFSTISASAVSASTVSASSASGVAPVMSSSSSMSSAATMLSTPSSVLGTRPASSTAESEQVHGKKRKVTKLSDDAKAKMRAILEKTSYPILENETDYNYFKRIGALVKKESEKGTINASLINLLEIAANLSGYDSTPFRPGKNVTIIADKSPAKEK